MRTNVLGPLPGLRDLFFFAVDLASANFRCSDNRCPSGENIVCCTIGQLPEESTIQAEGGKLNDYYELQSSDTREQVAEFDRTVSPPASKGSSIK